MRKDTKANTTLVFLNNLAGLDQFLLREKKEGIEYVIVCDDIEVKNSAQNINGIVAVDVVYQWKSFFSVSDSVKEVIKGVNDWMTILAEKSDIDSFLLEWFQSPEGGMVEQRIQSALLLIESFEKLVKTYQPNEVLIIADKKNEFESLVFELTMQSFNIPVSRRLFLNFSSIVPRMNKTLTFLREGYYIFNIIRIGFLKPKYNSQTEDLGIENKILFQLNQGTDKHVDNVSFLMKGLEEKGQSTIALCWNSHERWTKNTGKKKLNRLGLKALDLEKSLTFKNLLFSLYKPRLVWKNALLIEELLQKSLPNKYKDIKLAKLLWPSVFFFINGQLPQRLRFNSALENVFSAKKLPKAVKIWGVNEFFDGNALWRNIRKYGRPLKFSYWVGHTYEQVYAKEDKELGLFLVLDKNQKDIAIRAYGLKEDSVVIVGQSRYQEIFKFKKEVSKVDSIEYLGIKEQKNLIIAYDASAVVPGYLLPSEQAVLTDALLNLCERNRNLMMLIKKHPSQDMIGSLDQQIKNCKSSNVILLPTNESPYHFLNAADMLITKFSTIGLEAMYLDKPVLSCILDKEEGFKLFENVADYVFTIEDLVKKIESFLIEHDAFETWADEQRSRRVSYFIKNPSVSSSQSLEKAADAILSRIN